MKPRVKTKGIHAQVTWAKARRELELVLYELGIEEHRIECEAPPARYESDTAKPEEVAVTLHYIDEDRPVALTVSAGRRPVDNLRAIGLAMEARRLNIVRGIDEAVQQTYLALPAPKPDSMAAGADLRRLLELVGGPTKEGLDALYRAVAKQYHPDKGGTVEQMAVLNLVRDQIYAERGWS